MEKGKRSCRLVLVQTQLADLCTQRSAWRKGTASTFFDLTLIAMQSATTFASAQRFVLGGRMLVDENILAISYHESWRCLKSNKVI
jgi:hypothetical protein